MTLIQYITRVCQCGNHRACKGHKVDGHGCECMCHTKEKEGIS